MVVVAVVVVRSGGSKVVGNEDWPQLRNVVLLPCGQFTKRSSTYKFSLHGGTVRLLLIGSGV